MESAVDIGDILGVCDVSSPCVHGDGRDGAFLNSGGCSVAGARVGCCTCRGKNLQGASGDCCCLAQRYVGVALFLELPL